LEYIMKKTTPLRPIAMSVLILCLSGCFLDQKEPLNLEARLSTEPEIETPVPVVPGSLHQQLESALLLVAPDNGLRAFILPESDDFDNIPHDPNNQLTAEKVLLGQFLFHETQLATNGVEPSLTQTWSCASCHHADAGFKSGVAQGIGEGGLGFGSRGEGRVLAPHFDADSEDPSRIPDVQPMTSPTILNTAYQAVMLWNGQFGNMQGNGVNGSIDESVLMTPDTPKKENARQLAGLEIQAIAGLGVHRMGVTDNSALQTNAEYQWLFDAAYPEGASDVLEASGKAIAAYERTILANQAPFQRWLKGERGILRDDEMRGALVFFGKGNCVSCHTGPALSSQANATEDNIFMAVGFADFDTSRGDITGSVSENASLGRGGFTGIEEDAYRFKIPQLYNLSETTVFGHGASFRSIRDVVEYKNAGQPQYEATREHLDSRFVPLGLSEQEIRDLVTFLETGLQDPEIRRYVPTITPTGTCAPNADEQSKRDLNC
jgi:cytochrome c peroxidase